MIAPNKGNAKKVPPQLRVVAAFLLAVACLQPAALLFHSALWPWEKAGGGGSVTLRLILCVVSLTVACQLLLRLPFARLCALLFLLGYPAVLLFRYVLFPLRWQALSQWARLYEFSRVCVLVAMALLLLSHRVREYLEQQGER